MAELYRVASNELLFNIMSVDDIQLDKEPRDGELTAIERRCLDRLWSAADYFRPRRNPLVSAWLPRGSGGAPHALVCFQLLAGEVEIFRLGVVPQFRRPGYGRELLGNVLRYAAGQRVIKVYLEMRAGYSAARRLYDAMGFRRVGTREGCF